MMIDLLTVYLPGQHLKKDPSQQQATRRFGSRNADKNLFIHPYRDGSILQGSIPKYWCGENVSSPSKSQMEAALGKLEDRTGFNLRGGILFAFEVGRTLIVRRPPREYLDTWYAFGRFKKWTVADSQTVKLVTANRSFTGYDKTLQMKGQEMPEVFRGFHALRLELKYRTHQAVKRIYGRDLSPWDLVSRDVLDDLETRWRDFYQRIPKTRQVRIELDGLRQKEFIDVLAHIGANAFGMDRVQHLLADGQKAGDIDKSVRSRIRKVLRSVVADERLTDTTELTDEIDDLVRRT